MSGEQEPERPGQFRLGQGIECGTIRVGPGGIEPGYLEPGAITVGMTLGDLLAERPGQESEGQR